MILPSVEASEQELASIIDTAGTRASIVELGRGMDIQLLKSFQSMNAAVVSHVLED